MTDLTLTLHPEAAHIEWARSFEWHLDQVPEIIDQLVTLTIPALHATDLNKSRITGGGYIDNIRLDAFDVTNNGNIIRVGAEADATTLWAWVTSYTHAATEWLNHNQPTQHTPDLPPDAAHHKLDPDPLSARANALLTIGWLIDHTDTLYEIPELEEHKTEMFTLIRQLRGRYGIHRTPRRRRPRTCHTCGEHAVTIDWITPTNGSPKPVKAAKCKTCGQEYKQKEDTP